MLLTEGSTALAGRLLYLIPCFKPLTCCTRSPLSSSISTPPPQPAAFNNCAISLSSLISAGAKAPSVGSKKCITMLPVLLLLQLLFLLLLGRGGSEWHGLHFGLGTVDPAKQEQRRKERKLKVKQRKGSTMCMNTPKSKAQSSALHSSQKYSTRVIWLDSCAPVLTGKTTHMAGYAQDHSEKLRAYSGGRADVSACAAPGGLVILQSRARILTCTVLLV